MTNTEILMRELFEIRKELSDLRDRMTGLENAWMALGKKLDAEAAAMEAEENVH